MFLFSPICVYPINPKIIFWNTVACTCACDVPPGSRKVTAASYYNCGKSFSVHSGKLLSASAPQCASCKRNTTPPYPSLSHPDPPNPSKLFPARFRAEREPLERALEFLQESYGQNLVLAVFTCAIFALQRHDHMRTCDFISHNVSIKWL